MPEQTEKLDTAMMPVPVQHPVGPDEIVGHKTFHSPERGYWHEPLMRAEADEVMRQCDEAEAKRRELMPDEQTAVRMLFEAFQRLKELGWKEACYCPKDGSEFQAIEAGSTGFHRSLRGMERCEASEPSRPRKPERRAGSRLSEPARPATGRRVIREPRSVTLWSTTGRRGRPGPPKAITARGEGDSAREGRIATIGAWRTPIPLQVSFSCQLHLTIIN
jgi:hypothetical protein